MIGSMLGEKLMARNMERTLPAVLNQLKKHNYEINVVYDIGCNDGGWKRDHQKLFDEIMRVSKEKKVKAVSAF